MPTSVDTATLTRIDEARTLLKACGARIIGYDPGVRCEARVPGDHRLLRLNFDASEWAWLEPLLQELVGLRTLVLSPAAAPLEQVTVLVPGLRTVGENHRYAHLRAHMQEVRTQRDLVWYTLMGRPGQPWAHQWIFHAVTITLTRIAPRRLDASDGLPSALKIVKDATAAYLMQTPGEGHRYDDDPRFTWRYAQRRGKPKEYSVEMTLEVMP